MLKTPLPIDELTYRSIEKIETPDELFRIFERVVQSLPENARYEQCVEEFMLAWNFIHADL